MVKYQSQTCHAFLSKMTYSLFTHFIIISYLFPGRSIMLYQREKRVLQKHNLALKAAIKSPKILWSAVENNLYCNYEETAGCVWEDTHRQVLFYKQQIQVQAWAFRTTQPSPILITNNFRNSRLQNTNSSISINNRKQDKSVHI